jgi:hypothetical protein
MRPSERMAEHLRQQRLAGTATAELSISEQLAELEAADMRARRHDALQRAGRRPYEPWRTAGTATW